MYYQSSIPDPPHNSSLFPKISASSKECPAKHSAIVGHSQHISHFFPALYKRVASKSYLPPEALSQTPQPSSNLALSQR